MSSSERVVDLCLRAPADRSEDEIEFVARWVADKSSYFRTIRREAIREVVRDCDLVQASRQELIVSQGDKGDTFFILVTGRVSVYVANDDSSLAAEAATPEDAYQEEDDDELEELRLRRRLGEKVLEQGEGYAFGEIALTSPDSSRNASVLCESDCRLLAVHRPAFLRVLLAFQQQEFRRADEFIAGCSLFSGWRPKQLLSLRNSLRKDQLQFGHTVIRQGDACDGLVFIVSGSVKILMDVNKDHSQQQVEVALLGPGEIIGEAELSLGARKYGVTAVCAEQCTVYFLNSANCRRLLSRSRGSLKELRRRSMLRAADRAERLPLLRPLLPPLRSQSPGIKRQLQLQQLEEEKQQQQQQRRLEMGEFSQEALWSHMLRMYQSGRCSLWPAPAGPELLLRDWCRSNAERRRQLRQRDTRRQLMDSEAQAKRQREEAEAEERRRRQPRSLRRLRRDVADSADVAEAASSQELATAAAAAAAAAASAASRSSDKGRSATRNPQQQLLTNFELSTAHLKALELRLLQFHKDCDQDAERHKLSRASVVQPLPEIAEPSRPRVPGSRVLVKLRRCPARHANVSVVGHSHVTDHVVGKLPEWETVARRRRQRQRQLEEQLEGGPVA